MMYEEEEVDQQLLSLFEIIQPQLVITPANVIPFFFSISTTAIAWVMCPVPLPQKATIKRPGSPSTSAIVLGRSEPVITMLSRQRVEAARGSFHASHKSPQAMTNRQGLRCDSTVASY